MFLPVPIVPEASTLYNFVPLVIIVRILIPVFSVQKDFSVLINHYTIEFHAKNAKQGGPFSKEICGVTLLVS
jgi:hypothetical protein